jgi:mono/diheme cytochrome c family protein
MNTTAKISLVALIFNTQFAFSRARGTPLQQAPPAATQRLNPFDAQQDARRAGAKLYQRECAACHGEDARGHGKALPLASPEVREASPGALFWVLRNGSLWRGMPSFSHLPEEQRWQIVTYLKSL